MAFACIWHYLQCSYIGTTSSITGTVTSNIRFQSPKAQVCHFLLGFAYSISPSCGCFSGCAACHSGARCSLHTSRSSSGALHACLWLQRYFSHTRCHCHLGVATFYWSIIHTIAHFSRAGDTYGSSMLKQLFVDSESRTTWTGEKASTDR